MTVSPSAPASGFAPLSTLMPGMTPCDCKTSTMRRPSDVSWRIVSSKRITPLIVSPRPSVVKSSSRQARRLSSVASTSILSSRRAIVGWLSSAARMPLPCATRAFALVSSSCTFMADSLTPYPCHLDDGGPGCVTFTHHSGASRNRTHTTGARSRSQQMVPRCLAPAHPLCGG